MRNDCSLPRGNRLWRTFLALGALALIVSIQGLRPAGGATAFALGHPDTAWLKPYPATEPLAIDLAINEFVSSNGAGIADEDGEHSDWIEVYNRGDTVSLLGFGLSDDPARPLKWTFPDVTLSAGGYLLVWASDKDRAQPGQPLHTNFKISAEGETLVLSQPDGLLMDGVDGVSMRRDISYGRQPDGGSVWKFFATPTPGAANTTQGYTEVLDPPTFSQAGGFYAQPFALSLIPNNPGATILYTLDGSLPSAANLSGKSYHYKRRYPRDPGDPFGPLLTASYRTFTYTNPFTIADRSSQPNYLSLFSSTYSRLPNSYVPQTPVYKGTVVRAIATMPGALASDAATHTYFFTPDGASRYDLPVISLAIQEDHLFDYDIGVYNAGVDFDNWRLNDQVTPVSPPVPANYGRRGDAWEYPVSFELIEPAGQQALNQNLGFRIQGSWSRAYPQKSLRLYASSAYDDHDTIDYPFFAGLADHVLGQQITSFSRLLLRNSGNDNLNTRMRDGFVQTLLIPMGLDVQAFQPAVHFINGEYWGLINLRERLDRYYIASHYGIDLDDVAMIENYTEVEEGTADDLQDFLALRTYIAGHDMTDPQHYAYVAGQMDLQNFILYNVAQIYVKNTDWPGNNVHTWRKRTPVLNPDAPEWWDGRWRWVPYDHDFGFGPSFDGFDVTHDTLSFATAAGGASYPNPDYATVMLRKLLAHPDFRRGFINAMADHMNTTFQPDRVDALVDAIHSQIEPYLAEHAQRWRNTGDTSPQFLKDFGHQRPGWMQQHMLAYFGLPGTAQITLNTPNPDQGILRINTIAIDTQTPGLPNPAQPYPWQGNYYRDNPITVEARPLSGYIFAGWVEYPDVAEPVIELMPTDGLRVTALFQPAPPPTRREPHRLADGPFAFTAWSAQAQAGAWPEHMLLEQSSLADPTLDAAMDGLWTLPYDLTSRSRIVGLEEDGLGFINTGNVQAFPGAGYVGSAVLVLDTRGVDAVNVSWKAGTVVANTREYGLRLQYRIGLSGDFIDVLDAGGQPLSYLRQGDGQALDMPVVALPGDAVGQPVVEVRWKYYYISGSSGARPLLQLDDILVFDQAPQLRVTTYGDGSGVVTGMPGDIECNAACTATYQRVTKVTLTATPAAHSQFAGWSGACQGVNPICDVTITASSDVGAHFAPCLAAQALEGLRIVRNDAVAGVDLSWNAAANALSYQVWRSPVVYFLPAPDSDAPLAEIAATAFTDAGSLSPGHPPSFYVVTSANACGETSAISRRVGIFPFALEPGRH